MIVQGPSTGASQVRSFRQDIDIAIKTQSVTMVTPAHIMALAMVETVNNNWLCGSCPADMARVTEFCKAMGVSQTEWLWWIKVGSGAHKNAIPKFRLSQPNMELMRRLKDETRLTPLSILELQCDWGLFMRPAFDLQPGGDLVLLHTYVRQFRESRLTQIIDAVRHFELCLKSARNATPLAFTKWTLGIGTEVVAPKAERYLAQWRIYGGK